MLPKNPKAVIEMGCGKAELSRALAQENPDINYVCVDLKADRLWKAAKLAGQAKLGNVIFIQSDILKIQEYLPEELADGIWITFPDPFPKKRQAKHRMLNRNFLDIYKQLLKSGGWVQLKTDNEALFEWTLELLARQPDVRIEQISFDMHESKDVPDDARHITHYESMFMGEGIRTKYLRFVFV